MIMEVGATSFGNACRMNPLTKQNVRLKCDKGITVETLEALVEKIMDVAGSNDLEAIIKPLRVSITDSLGPSKCMPLLANMAWVAHEILKVAPNTKLPKKSLECALENVNSRRRWFFGHVRLENAACNVGGAVRLMMAKLHDMRSDGNIRRRAMEKASDETQADKVQGLLDEINFYAPAPSTTCVSTPRSNSCCSSDDDLDIFDKVLRSETFSLAPSSNGNATPTPAKTPPSLAIVPFASKPAGTDSAFSFKPMSPAPDGANERGTHSLDEKKQMVKSVAGSLCCAVDKKAPAFVTGEFKSIGLEFAKQLIKDAVGPKGVKPQRPV